MFDEAASSRYDQPRPMSTQRNLGTLGFHLDGRACRVGCSFCYLGVRPAAAQASLDPAVAAQVVASAPARDVAVAVSEPASRWREGVRAIVEAARKRGLPVAITTTAAVVAHDMWVLENATRLTVSVDPEKDRGSAEIDLAALREALAAARAAHPELEIIALVSLASPAFCERLAGGLLAELVALPEVNAVALNGLKPPPPWCDRAFWLGFLAKIRPLLDAHLARRLHLDCYVNARILGLGGCPAKPDVTAGNEFRACVYQRRADFTFSDADDFAQRTADYEAPAICPFPIV
jgi:hypothetical protein